MKKKIIALILCICLISCTCIQPAYAMGAESVIVGGTAGALGITLTMPQVALLIAAGFGLIYATQHADEIAQGLDTALNNAANNIENGMEQLTTWKDNATNGIIALATAAPWIIETIKSWISGLYNDTNNPVTMATQYAANEPFPKITSWDGTTMSIPVPCSVIRYGTAQTPEECGADLYVLNAIMIILSYEKFDGCKTLSMPDGSYVYAKKYTWGTNPLGYNPLSEYNQKAFDTLRALPETSVVKELYPDKTIEWATAAAWHTGQLPSDSICADGVVGGVGNVIGEHDIGNVNVPDMDIGDSQFLFPPHVLEGNSIDNVLNDILTRLKQQELSWSDYMSDVAVGNPSISIEGKDFVIDDTGVTDIPVEDVLPDNPSVDVEVPEGLEPFTISLTDFFPFCIPFDIVDFVNVLCAEPEAPRFEWKFTWYGGATDTLTIDLKPFDGVAQLLRNMELLLFCIGLAMITRNQIRG